MSGPARPPDICPEARTVYFLSSFHAGLGTSEPMVADDCSYRKSKVCQQMVLGRKPGLRLGSPPRADTICIVPSGPQPDSCPRLQTAERRGRRSSTQYADRCWLHCRPSSLFLTLLIFANNCNVYLETKTQSMEMVETQWGYLVTPGSCVL